MNAKVDVLYKKIENMSITLTTPTHVALVSLATLNCEIYGTIWHIANDFPPHYTKTKICFPKGLLKQRYSHNL